MIYLFQRQDLQAYEVIGALVLMAMVSGLGLVLTLGLWRPDWLGRLLHFIQRVVNGVAARLKRPGLLDAHWADRNAEHFTEASTAIATRPRQTARTFLIALGAHLVDILSLSLIFQAFHQPVGPGVLLAGYTIGILSWIVSPAPQGVGIVEGVIALVYTSLAVPAAQATVIALTFRGLTFWLPLLVGFLLLRRVRTFQEQERGEADVWSVRVVASLAALMGLINILSALRPGLFRHMERYELYLPLAVRDGTRLATVLAGFALLLLARGLIRRKRAAWLLTIAVLAASSVVHVVKGLDYGEALLAAALLVWLVYLRPYFHARSDPPSIRQGLVLLGLAFAFTLAYGAFGFYLLDRHFAQPYGLWTAIIQTVQMFVMFSNPGLQPLTGFGRYFVSSIYIVGATTLGYALIALAQARSHPPAGDAGRAQPRRRHCRGAWPFHYGPHDPVRR